MATKDSDRMAVDVVIMAAGRGTRMKSRLPKVLHRLGGASLLQHVLQTVLAMGADRIVVVTGHGADEVEAAVEGPANLVFVRQLPQLGTGHAVQQAVPLLGDTGVTLILNGDVPLIEPVTAAALVAASGAERLALLTISLADPTGYGRIVRAPTADGIVEGTVQGIVEEKDATPAQRQIAEVYTGAMAAPTASLKRWLAALRNDNAQGEYYLTDVVGMAVVEGVAVVTAQPSSVAEVLGVNSPAQLADLERRFQQRQAAALMEAGVRLADPARIDIRGSLGCGQDVEIDINCVFEGKVTLGDRVRIGAHCMIRDAAIDADVVIHPFSHIDGAGADIAAGVGVTIGAASRIGPFARLRPGATLGEGVHVGNFVEVKNSTLGAGAKANHLAYLGDASLGERVNFGAGSITANYDGVAKHRTTIGADVQVGSNCVLIAPLVVGAGATIGAGSTVSRDAPAGQLTVARARQASLAGWKRPVRPAKKPDPKP